VKPSECYICQQAIWPELSLVRVSAEFELDTSFCYLLHLIWCMIEEYRWRFSVISWKGSDRLCDILAFTWFWIIYPDDIETIKSYLLISENSGFCVTECSECSLDSEICLMIAISIDDTMSCCDIIEWVEEVFESTIHPVEEIPGDTEKFYVLGIDLVYDIAEIPSSIDMSDMDVRDKGDFFTLPVLGEVLYFYLDALDNCISRMIDAISTETESNYNSDESYEWYRYMHSEILENIYNNPHGKYRK